MSASQEKCRLLPIWWTSRSSWAVNKHVCIGALPVIGNAPLPFEESTMETLLDRASQVMDLGLRCILILLMASLATLIIAGVVFRYSGNSLRFYDELAVILLAWITYYGAAYAALHSNHMATTGVVNMLPPRVRIALFLFSRVVVIGFLGVLVVMGLRVLDAISGMHLTSLTSFPRALAQHAVPVGAALYILAEVLRLPKALREARDGDIKAAAG